MSNTDIFPQEISFPYYALGRDASDEQRNFPGAYCIFLSAFTHQATPDSLNSRAKRTLANDLYDHGWRLHHTLLKKHGVGCAAKSNTSSRNKNDRPTFGTLFTPSVQDSFLGRLAYLDDDEFDPNLESAGYKDRLFKVLQDRLDDNSGPRHSETLLFSQHDSQWIGQQLALYRSTPYGTYEESIVIPWADLMLFSDGVGLLAFKVTFPTDHDAKLGDLTQLFMTLRDSCDASVKVGTEASQNAGVSFWNAVVLKHWLGGTGATYPSFSPYCSGGKEVDGRDDENASGSQPKQLHLNLHSRYCKVLTACQLGQNIEDSANADWGHPESPIAIPPLHPGGSGNDTHQQEDFSTKHMGALLAAINGYPSARDILLTDIATGGRREGASIGSNGRAWQYNVEYLRELMGNHSIQVWEYWSALALRDTITFLSYDKEMPIMRQAEERYFPLYAYVYMLKFRIDTIASDIVDHEMFDVIRGRNAKEQFQRFRNQYWFQEVTTDFLGIEIYAKLLKGMQVNETYETVKTEVAEVSEYLKSKWDQITKLSLGVLVLLIAPLQTLWESKIFPFLVNADQLSLIWVGGGTLLSALAVFALRGFVLRGALKLYKQLIISIRILDSRHTGRR